MSAAQWNAAQYAHSINQSSKTGQYSIFQNTQTSHNNKSFNKQSHHQKLLSSENFVYNHWIIIQPKETRYLILCDCCLLNLFVEGRWLTRCNGGSGSLLLLFDYENSCRGRRPCRPWEIWFARWWRRRNLNRESRDLVEMTTDVDSSNKRWNSTFFPTPIWKTIGSSLPSIWIVATPHLKTISQKQWLQTCHPFLTCFPNSRSNPKALVCVTKALDSFCNLSDLSLPMHSGSWRKWSPIWFSRSWAIGGSSSYTNWTQA